HLVLLQASEPRTPPRALQDIASCQLPRHCQEGWSCQHSTAYAPGATACIVRTCTLPVYSLRLIREQRICGADFFAFSQIALKALTVRLEKDSADVYAALLTREHLAALHKIPYDAHMSSIIQLAS